MEEGKLQLERDKLALQQENQAHARKMEEGLAFQQSESAKRQQMFEQQSLKEQTTLPLVR